MLSVRSERSPFYKYDRAPRRDRGSRIDETIWHIYENRAKFRKLNEYLNTYTIDELLALLAPEEEAEEGNSEAA